MLRQPSAAPHWRVLKPTKCAAQSPIAHKRIAAGTDHSSRVAGINRLVHGNKRRWHSNHLPLQRSWSVRAALSGIRCWPMRHAACGRMLQRVSRLSLRLKVKDCQALSDKYVKPRARCMRGRPAIIPVHTAAVETVGWPFRANLFSRRAGIIPRTKAKSNGGSAKHKPEHRPCAGLRHQPDRAFVQLQDAMHNHEPKAPRACVLP